MTSYSYQERNQQSLVRIYFTSVNQIWLGAVAVNFWSTIFIVTASEQLEFVVALNLRFREHWIPNFLRRYLIQKNSNPQLLILNNILL